MITCICDYISKNKCIKCMILLHVIKHKLKHFGATKIVIKSLPPHKNIPRRVIVNMNNRNSFIAIFCGMVYKVSRS